MTEMIAYCGLDCHNCGEFLATKADDDDKSGIKLCGMEKGVANCAFCVDYPCTQLKEFFEIVPECKLRLDRVKGS